jgi:hypothetical protein
MKKLTLLFALILSFSLVSMAQSPIGKGGRQFNFGFGFGSDFPVYASYDFGVHKDITVAPRVAFDLNGFDWLTISGRGDYHFNTLLDIPDNWDFYAGLNLGFRIGLSNNWSSGPDLGAQVGGRYYWNEKWGVNVEFGGGSTMAGGGIGLSMRM